MKRTLLRLLTGAVFCLGAALPAHADAPDTLARGAMHALDYISVDYAEAVDGGEVVSAAEYAEMREFAAAVEGRLEQLPPAPGREALLADAGRLRRAIAERADHATITGLCSSLVRGIAAAWQVQLAPAALPTDVDSAALYQTNCASCHGATGLGDGPAGAGLEPAPSNFHERERQGQRSVFGLYNTITLGVDGTGMASYAHLSEDERWALALHVSRWFATPAETARGEALWASGDYTPRFADIAALTGLTPAAARERGGEDEVAVLAWLRANPEALGLAQASPLAFAREQVQAALTAYADGDRTRAYEHTLTAYLEGFELTEAALRTVDNALMVRTEKALSSLRASVKAGAAQSQVQADAEAALALLAESQTALDTSHLSAGMAFFTAFIILIREGLEAILVLAAISAFLNKANRPDAMRWVNAGWISALALGALTWVATKQLIDFSGASRELTEGITALLAAGMLLYVGCWLHNHAHARQWQAFIREKVAATLSTGTLWSLALVSFFAVFREIVETILFYETLWAQADAEAAPAIGIGFAVALAVLLGIAWALFRFSARLPLRLFFTVNTALLFLLAVVFAGKGIAALQEAGKLAIAPLDLPAVGVLGIYPTAQGLGLQLLIVLGMAGFLLWRWRSDRMATA